MILTKRSLFFLLVCLSFSLFVFADEGQEKETVSQEMEGEGEGEIEEIDEEGEYMEDGDEEGYDLNDMLEGDDGEFDMEGEEDGDVSMDAAEGDSSTEPADGALYKTDGDVIVLNGKNFDQVVASVPLLLVEFYAPWCGHCKALAPKYAAAAKELQANDPPLYIAKLDAANEKNRALAEKYDVKGFPTLMLFRNNTEASSAISYGGARTTEGIVDYMKKKHRPVNEVTSKEELTALLNANEVVAMFYMAEDNKEKEAFRTSVFELAAADENVAFGITSDVSFFEEKDQKSLKTSPMILFKTFDEGKNVYPDKTIDREKVVDFIMEHKMPEVTTYSEEKAATIFGGNIQSHFLIFSDESKPYHETLITTVKGASKLNKKKIVHIYIPNSEANILKHFNLENENLPALALVHLGQSMQKFPYPVEGAKMIELLSTTAKAKTLEKEIIAFEKTYLDGELKPTLNSQEPIDDSQDAVKTIVGKEFEKRVMESSQDVLLEFYAPWCGHCKSLAPKYEALAEQLADVKTIMVAKMDYTENQIDHPKVEIQGFPTIILFPNGKKDQPIMFQEGKRDEKTLLAFLQENASPFTIDGKAYGAGASAEESEKKEDKPVKELHEEL